ncbi:hypothetical protein PCASD_06705 [Puccinia coronata f. sp. avenae]|uniref:C2H2-type domain-containing protein n=1 Tax=Puccinia coronata f. sp. avenae TaxID=200324 RepID=A0A2N5TF96_9BASI|nr:hypothetical protein PCASD_06705 [Puccinia coronata f. sp. avenae]
MFAFQPTPNQNMDLVCKWSKPHCLKNFSSAEELFNHLCDCHVGRKRNGTLSLICSWEGCDHKAAKRDHMTSHMMVHCPLRTNVCGICDKTFKRSYDLRKHEVTHTAAHHELHTRSRAVVYTELEIPFTVEINSSTPVNRGRVYSLPQDQSGNWIGGNVHPPAVEVGHRERSLSVPRHNPYQRPHSGQTYPQRSSSWNNDSKCPSDRPQRSASIAEAGPYDVNAPLFNQFQFLQQYSLPNDVPAPHLFGSTADPPSTSSGSSASSNPSSGYVAPSGDWADIFSFMADTRRESEACSIPSEDFSGSDGLSGLFGSEPTSEILRTSSLPCQVLHPPANSSFNPYDHLATRHSFSAAVPEEPLALTDTQIRDLLNPQQPYEQAYQVPYVEYSGQFQSDENTHQIPNYDHMDNLDMLLSLADLSGFSQAPGAPNGATLMDIPQFQYLG